VRCALLDALYFKYRLCLSIAWAISRAVYGLMVDQCGEIRAVVTDPSDFIPIKGPGGAFEWVIVTARRVSGPRLVADLKKRVRQ
jgi:hypothetical protein